LLWAFAATGGLGLLLGLWFRVPALIAVSGLTAATYLPIALTNQGSMSALLMTVALLTALQFGYVAGLVLAYAWSRTFASWPRLDCQPATRAVAADRTQTPLQRNETDAKSIGPKPHKERRPVARPRAN
jgi:hypothetical protein